MCTASWLFRNEGFELFFNRDELRTRMEAVPPQIHRRRDARFLSPIDRDAGGTWIGVNEHAVCLFLLNLYGVNSPEKGKHTSRGHLVIDLMDSTSVEMVAERVGNLGLEEYRPFTLAAISRPTASKVFIWNGKRLEICCNPVLPLSSSSFETEAVIRSRRRVFGEMDLVDSQRMDQYHRSHIPDKGPYSVCMHRVDAKTVSMSRISVSNRGIRFDYTAGNPCDWGIAVRSRLPMAGA